MKDTTTSPVRLTPAEEAPGVRAARLFEQARAAAFEDIEAFRILLNMVLNHGDGIAEGGDVYPFGYREIARKISAEAHSALDLMRVTDSKVRRDA